jgi:NADH:ubiquinone oxidoreductase subunit 4 (subunit M)
MLRGWFHVFGGPVAADGPRHAILPRERVALTTLLATLFLLGLWPAPLVQVLERATGQLLGTTADPHAPAAEAGGTHAAEGAAAATADLQVLPDGR